MCVGTCVGQENSQASSQEGCQTAEAEEGQQEEERLVKEEEGCPRKERQAEGQEEDEEEESLIRWQRELSLADRSWVSRPP